MKYKIQYLSDNSYIVDENNISLSQAETMINHCVLLRNMLAKFNVSYRANDLLVGGVKNRLYEIKRIETEILLKIIHVMD